MDTFSADLLILVGMIGLVGTTNHIWATLAEYFGPSMGEIPKRPFRDEPREAAGGA